MLNVTWSDSIPVLVAKRFIEIIEFYTNLTKIETTRSERIYGLSVIGHAAIRLMFNFTLAQIKNRRVAPVKSANRFVLPKL